MLTQIIDKIWDLNQGPWRYR